MPKRKALYAGSFDPITRGHIDIVKKALDTFDVVHIACAQNSGKNRLFSLNQAQKLMSISLAEELDPSQVDAMVSPENTVAKLLDGKLEIGSFYGTTTIVQYARQIKAKYLVRGLRQISDFNDEFTFHGIIEHVAPDLTLAHFISKSEFLHVSSSTARELAKFNSDVSWLVTPAVEHALGTKIKNGSISWEEAAKYRFNPLQFPTS